MNLLIKNATIITVNARDEILVGSDLAVCGKRIVGVGKAPDDFQADRVIDGRGRLVMPGLINAHTHLAMTLMRNYADDLPFWSWLMEKVKPLEDHLSAEDVHHGAKLGIAEMVRGGTTCFHDMYFFMDEVACAVSESGIRACLSGALFDVSGTGERLLGDACQLHREWHGSADGRISVRLGPHSPYLCSPEYLREIREEALRLECGLHMHVSESRKEVVDSIEQHGKSPVRHLAELEMFDCPTLAAHALHVDTEDLALLSRNSVHVSHNPTSNLKLANGFAPVTKMMEAGINVALGTDSAASNNNLNLFEEMHLAALLAKAVDEDASALPAEQALRMATINGARALGLYEEIGSLEVGKKADLIMLDTRKPHLVPLHNPLALIVYSAQAADVETVIIDGRTVMENRELLTLDETGLLGETSRQAVDFVRRSRKRDGLR